MKKIPYIFYALVAVLGISGCIYPYTPDITKAETRLVIEGDITIGEVSSINVQYVVSLDNTTGSAGKSHPEASAHIECSDGTVYPSADSVSRDGSFTVDLTKADPDKQYRIYVKNMDDGREYVSVWQTPLKPAVIDSLSYILEYDKDRMAIALSMHSLHDNSYFRWTYTEWWEYHAYYRNELVYRLPVRETPYWNDGYGIIEQAGRTESYYNCWKSAESTDIQIFSTEKQTDDRFVDLEFHLIPRSSNKISDLYYIEVRLAAMSKEAYEYWLNIQNNSQNTGGLFSPNPSEMIGNIRCLQDTTELVIGYINAAQISKAHLFVNNNVTDFYVPEKFYPTEPEVVEMEQWRTAYANNWRPLYAADPSGQKILWTTINCADCRYYGGDKNKPAFWPNDDY